MFIIMIILFPTIIITSIVLILMMITMAQLNSSMTIWLRGSSHTPGKDREGHFLRILVDGVGEDYTSKMEKSWCVPPTLPPFKALILGRALPEDTRCNHQGVREDDQSSSLKLKEKYISFFCLNFYQNVLQSIAFGRVSLLENPF